MLSNFHKLYNYCRPKFERLAKNRHFAYGGPFFCFIIIGAVVLKVSQDIRMEVRKSRTLSKQQMDLLQHHFKPVTLEEQYEKWKHLGDEDWENVRIPRPWEKPTAKQ